MYFYLVYGFNVHFIAALKASLYFATKTRNVRCFYSSIFPNAVSVSVNSEY